MSTEGKVYCRVSMTWLDPDEYKRRYDAIEEAAFMARANQGDLCAPMVILDGMKPVQSQTNGVMYDSKSAIRREYRRAGVIEVGNDIPREKPKPDWKAEKQKTKAAVQRAFSYAGFGAP